MATISIPDRDLEHIPVKPGCHRRFMISWVWTETKGYPTVAQAEEEYARRDAESAGLQAGTLHALDVPGDALSNDGTYYPDTVGIDRHIVGSRAVNAKMEEDWEG